MSLGQYKDEPILHKTIEKEDNEIIEKADDQILKKGDQKTNGKDDQKIINNHQNDSNEYQNRVERQLINQMLSQIDPSKIPLSKFRFKKNKTTKLLIKQTIIILLFITSIILWIQRKEIIDCISLIINKDNVKYIQLTLYIICAIAFFCSLSIMLYYLNRKNIIKLSKINLKGAEATLKDDNCDETILDRDIKELVYLLNGSGTSIVVFEDLDRYDDITIYTKLRELNFLVNSYAKNNGQNKIIRFVYLLKDSLFISKNRTKFFDFIVPIVPIIDATTSENELATLLSGIPNAPDKNFLFNISLYVDDMRLLKNIVNEYIVYSGIVPMHQYELKENVLFSIIALKNIFPKEFDNLQKRTGYIVDVFGAINRYRIDLKKQFEKNKSALEENIREIKKRTEDNKFEAMALVIPAYVYPDIDVNISWPKFLKQWSNSKNNRIYFYYNGHGSYFTYDEFIERFISNDENNQNIIKRRLIDRSDEFDKLKSEVESLNDKITRVDNYTYKDIIFNMQPEAVDNCFICRDETLNSNRYLELIRFMVVEGLLDQTVWYYIGCFNVEQAQILDRNDTIYIKSLKSGKDVDPFLQLENPSNVLNRLSDSDFKKINILNSVLLHFCIEHSFTDKVIRMIETVKYHNLFNILSGILNTYDLQSIIKFVEIFMNKNDINTLIRILQESSISYPKVLDHMLIPIYSNEQMESSDLEKFNKYIESNEKIITLISDEYFDTFISNVKNADTKFDDLSKDNISKDRMIKIEKILAYKMNIQNVVTIVNSLSIDNINYGELISYIFESDRLTSTKDYIDDNFVDFMMQYIDFELVNNVEYRNNEDVLIKILDSDLTNEYMLKYLDNNKILITDLSQLNYSLISEDIYKKLLDDNLILCSKENLKLYWEEIQKCRSEFIEYLERNINAENEEDLLNSNIDICNKLINETEISDELFSFTVKYAKLQIESLNEKLSNDRINTLIKQGLIKVTQTNINILVQNKYYDELVLLANDSSQEDENKIIDRLCNYNSEEHLIYSLININISDRNTCKLIDLLGENVRIEKIKPNKELPINYVLDYYLTNDNIKYIINTFDSIVYKDKFINNLLNDYKILSLDKDLYTENLMNYILESDYVDKLVKLKLIFRKIQEGTEISKLQNYISKVEEIKELADVWEGKQPIIDNDDKLSVSEFLVKYGYVKYRKLKNKNRIMCVKTKYDSIEY